MPYNLKSPSNISSPCDLDDLQTWIDSELSTLENPSVRTVVSSLCTNIDAFVNFPSQAMLLWNGCDRIKPPGSRQRLHKYPDSIKAIAKQVGIKLDGRPNGPAIASFQIAGGKRPQRYGSTNAWSVHHIYSGKFPYFEREQTIHATKLGLHFSQSAGLIAVHPIADASFDEFPFLTWFVRALAFQRFGYDPDSAFSENQDEFGFATGTCCKVFH